MVRFAAENFIPVAVDKQELLHRAAGRKVDPEEQELIRKYTGGKTGSLAVHLVTADGAPLTDRNLFRMQTAAEVLETLKAAAAKFGPIAPRPVVAAAWRDPLHGAGAAADGSVQLALTIRLTDEPAGARRPVVDHLRLTAEQWRGLLPPERKVGTEYRVPEEIARLFARGLSASSDQSNMLDPKHLTAVELTGRVVGERDGAAEILLTGRLAGQRKYVNGDETLPAKATLNGLLVLDGSGRPVRFLLLYEGTFKMPWERLDRPTAALAEWSASASRGRN